MCKCFYFATLTGISVNKIVVDTDGGVHMKCFKDLRNFVLDKAKEGQTSYKVIVNDKSIAMQIYSETAYIQANMRVGGGSPVIKFAEKISGEISVAVSYYNDPEIIKYGKSKDFELDDHLYKLLEDFPDGVDISIIVAALLSI